MSIVVLTGAGVSAESGLATFRGPGGLWEGHRVEDVCTPDALARHPELVHRFYDERRAALDQVGPNAAHHALATLERERPDVTLVTQNVDDLHARAGGHPLPMHGQLRSALCAACGEREPWEGSLPPASVCSHCSAPALRPDVVFFGEMPMHMERTESALAACDLFVSIGTSGNVYPAAGFVRMAAAFGARTLELNLDPSEGTPLFDEHRHGPATELVPAWVNEALA